MYTDEASLPNDFTDKNNVLYSRIARAYDILVKVTPVWNRWISQAIPYIKGNRVLEVSFGTGLLLSQYAADYETYGVDYNSKMVDIAKKNLMSKGIYADLIEGNVESLPYDDNSFDTVLVTMAFSGYPDAFKAMSEMTRVLRPDGRLVMVDINYPKNMNRIGCWLTKFWIMMGDVIRDMNTIFVDHNLVYRDEEIGGFGSVHLYVAEAIRQY